MIPRDMGSGWAILVVFCSNPFNSNDAYLKLCREFSYALNDFLEGGALSIIKGARAAIGCLIFSGDGFVGDVEGRIDRQIPLLRPETLFLVSEVAVAAQKLETSVFPRSA